MERSYSSIYNTYIYVKLHRPTAKVTVIVVLNILLLYHHSEKLERSFLLSHSPQFLSLFSRTLTLFKILNNLSFSNSSQHSVFYQPPRQLADPICTIRSHARLHTIKNSRQVLITVSADPFKNSPPLYSNDTKLLSGYI